MISRSSRRRKLSLAGRHNPRRVVGIDLGTTSSSIAEILWQPGGDTMPQVRCQEVEQATSQDAFPESKAE